MSLLNGVHNVPTCPTLPKCPRALRVLRGLQALHAQAPNYVLQTRKLKILVLMKSNEGSFTDVFKGTEF